jgi:ribosomal protein S11
VFEQDGQAIFDAFRKLLRKGSPYAFQVLADRAFGKMKAPQASKGGAIVVYQLQSK